MMCATKWLVVLVLLPAFIHGAVPRSELFPFGPLNGDTRLPPSDDDFANVTLTRLPGGLTFFNTTFPYIVVNNNGFFSFHGRHGYIPHCLPLASPMIAPFWADIDTRVAGNVGYRETTDPQVLRKARTELTTAFPTLQLADLVWAFVATWDEVRPSGANGNHCTNFTNTFQLTLTTDGFYTFALMYYSKISWASANGGSQCTGTYGSDARSGFDYGDGKTFFTIPTSCTPGILGITETSNVHSGGKWVFRLDDKVKPGGLVTNLTTVLFTLIQDLLKTVGNIKLI